MPYRVATRRKSHWGETQHQSSLGVSDFLSELDLFTHKSWAINLPSAFGVYKKVCQGWYKRASIACEEVLPLLFPHAL